MTTTKIKTIARNRTAKIEAIFAQATSCKRYDAHTYYRGEPTTPEGARTALMTFRFAKLTDHGDGRYHVDVHRNKWYVIESNG